MIYDLRCLNRKNGWLRFLSEIKSKLRPGLHAATSTNFTKAFVDVLMPSTLNGYPRAEVNANSCIILFNKKITEYIRFAFSNLYTFYGKSINVVNSVTVVSQGHKNTSLYSNFKFSCSFKFLTVVKKYTG